MSKQTFTLTSNDLGGTFSKEQIMNSFGCDGGNVSPHLQWENAPDGTQAFAISMHDPDAPTPSGFYHWAVFGIPASVSELPSGAGDPEKKLLPEGAFMGKADTGVKAYGGPCPPEGDFWHRYIITVHALNTTDIDVNAETPLAQAIFKIVTGAEIARASLIAYYRK